MADNQEHALDTEFGSHVSEGSGDAGACLTRHVTNYKEGDSCSHRWQAYRAATENEGLYNWDAYKSIADHPYKKYIRTSIARGKTGRMRILPDENTWDLGESSTYYRGPVETTSPNFREYATIPYYHNAHHIIPNSVLNGCLYEAAETDVRVFALARKALLDAKYNLNHKINMVILPMSKYVAAALCLPRHIAGIETEPGAKPEYVNHSQYNAKVRGEVTDIITDFAGKVNFQQHDVEAPEIARALLEDISTGIFNKLKAWGKVAKGRSINELEI